jgi:hypothetical protein
VALSAFDDKSRKPKQADLKRTLARTSAHWDGLISHIATEYSPLDETWNFAGAKWGWSLRLKQKKGRGIRIEIRSKKDIEIAKGIAAIKMAN